MKKGWLMMAVVLSVIFARAAQAACPQPTILEGILKTNVDKDGYVDYDSVRINKGGDLLEFTSLIETSDLKDCSESDKLAFWINAYNAHAIRLILARPNLKMLSDDFKMFGEQFKVAKIKVSLNEIEHRIIRSAAKNGGPIEGYSLAKLDPRIHFALVCGAVDSPRLLNHAYTGPTLEASLQSAAQGFANNPKYIRVENGKLTMSALLHWYAADFDGVGGVPAYFMVLTDAAQRPDKNDIDTHLKTDFPQATQFKFDWTINSIKNKPAAATPATGAKN